MRIFIITSLIFSSCLITKAQTRSSLSGKAAVIFNDSLFIYDNSATWIPAFKIKSDKIDYAGFRWTNKTDNLIGTEYFNNDKSGINRSNIVCFDLSGKIVKTIYESVDGEIAGYAYLSKNDKRLLFTTEEKGNIKINPLEGLNRRKSIAIMDFNSGKFIQKIEKVGTSLSLQLNESPWLFDENRFIFSLSSDRQIIVDETEINSIKKDTSGLYIYDLVTSKKTLLVPQGCFGICSPVDFRIAYMKNQSIWVMDLKGNSTKKIYDIGKKDKLVNLHWTPDGKFIYIAYYKYYHDNKIEPREKLVESATGKTVPFNKMLLGFQQYTWK